MFYAETRQQHQAMMYRKWYRKRGVVQESMV